MPLAPATRELNATIVPASARACMRGRTPCLKFKGRSYGLSRPNAQRRIPGSAGAANSGNKYRISTPFKYSAPGSLKTWGVWPAKKKEGGGGVVAGLFG